MSGRETAYPGCSTLVTLILDDAHRVVRGFQQKSRTTARVVLVSRTARSRFKKSAYRFVEEKPTCDGRFFEQLCSVVYI
jgi:hypothetical protein